METSDGAGLGDAFAEFAEESLALAEEMLPAAAEAWAIEPDEPRGVRVARIWLEQITQARHGIPPDREESQRILDQCFLNRPCNDCAAPIGQPHEHGCDVERCQYTGLQWIGCGGYVDNDRCRCDDLENYDADGYTIHVCGEDPHDCGSEVWDGVWPGYGECVEWGWYSHFVPVPGRTIGPFAVPAGNAWVRCGPGDLGAGPNLNRLRSGECRWDRNAKRWTKR